MNDSNKQDDTDILRAMDVVPPYNTNNNPKQILREGAASVGRDLSAENKPVKTSEGTISPLNMGRAEKTQGIPANAGDWDQQRGEIPKFDLAEQIMAEQRKITAVRRKAPGQKTKAPDKRPQVQSTRYAIKPLILSEQEKIIAEIVTRDIQKLCRGDSSGLSI